MWVPFVTERCVCVCVASQMDGSGEAEEFAERLRGE